MVVSVNQKVEVCFSIIQYLMGLCFGRWDVRLCNGDKVISELPDPFTPLPVCSPGMLQNNKGLPINRTDVLQDYPINISWNGILVDDKGHSSDIVSKMREIIELIWGMKAESIEREICSILNINDIRSYCKKPAKFFFEHLKKYSKSRRQAPIYWPLSTVSGSYILWIYYHRLDDQILYTCVNDFIDPKLKQVEQDTIQLRDNKNRSTQEEKNLEQLINFGLELADFKNELLHIAKFWKPNLNDGVLITAAPLWKLFQHKPWQKKLKESWKKLEKGDYDWAHLAYSIWPERVKEKCKKDKSLAIAHDLEDLYEES